MKQPDVPIRLLSIIEAETVTGPARNLISFCRTMQELEGSAGESPQVHIGVLVLGARKRSQPSRFVEAARDCGIDVEEIEEERRFDWRVLGRLREAIARRSPAIVETHSVKSHFLMKLLGLPQSCPWVAFHHGYTVPDLKMRMYNQLDRWSLSGARRVISLSAAFERELVAAGVHKRNIRVIGSSINPAWKPDQEPSRVPELRRQWRLSADERVILSVGRLSREKGHLDLLRAFARLDTLLLGPRPLKLVIAGDGPERARLIAESESLGIADRLCLAGHVDDVAPLYQLASVFVLPSFSEGSPLALLEAMVSGVPVVANAVGGVPEMVNRECAIFTEPRNPEVLASAITRVLSDANLAERLQINARKTALNNYGPDARSRKLLELYREVLNSQVC